MNAIYGKQVSGWPKPNTVTVRSDLPALRAQLKHLTTGRADVGIFASGDARTPVRKDASDSNVEIGLAHEFGYPPDNLPERSWLRLPLFFHLDVSGIDWISFLLKKGYRKTLGLLGVIGEQTVQEGFATAGWGQWPELSPRTIRQKGHARILIETGQMRKAVASRVIVP